MYSYLTVQRVEILPAVEVLQPDSIREVARSAVKAHHHPVNGEGEPRQLVILHHPGSCGLLLLLRRHLEVRSLVLADGPRDPLDHAAHSGLRNAATEPGSSLEVTASIVVQRHKHLLQHRQRPPTVGWEVQLVVEHGHQSVHRRLVEAEGALKLSRVQHNHMVRPPVVHHRLPHQLQINHFLKLLHLLHLPHLPHAHDVPDLVHC